MPAYRPAGIDQLRTFHGSTGQLLAGGYLRFYIAGTTTLQDVYGDRALTVNNGSTVALDASGRPSLDIWADTGDSYLIELYDADDVKQGEIEDVEVPGGAGQTIPVPESGKFLTGDGTNFLTATIREVPDPAGHANHYLQTDASTVFWAAGPEDGEVPELPIVVTANSIRLGAVGSDFGLLQWGTGTAESTGTKTATGTITYGQAFKTGTTPEVFVQLTGNGVTFSGSAYPKHSSTAATPTGATIGFSTTTGGTSTDNFGGADITGDISFFWFAVGVVADPT